MNLILSPSWPCCKQPTAKAGDSIHLWRKVRELHLRRSCESLLSQPVLTHECKNTNQHSTNHTAWWLPRTGRGKFSKKPGKHMTWTYLSYYTTPCFNTMFLLMLPLLPLLHYPRSSVREGPTTQGCSCLEGWEMLSEAPSFVIPSHTGRFHKGHQKRATLSMIESTTIIALKIYEDLQLRKILIHSM